MSSKTRFVQIFVVALSLCAFNLFADIPYMPISFKLSTNKKVYHVGERIQFKLSIINSDPVRTYPIVIPGNQNKGNKLITLNASSVNAKTNFYTNVAKEDPVIRMNCNQPGSVWVRNLAPHDSLVVYFFLNDHKNFNTQTASHHQLLPELKEGKYQLLIYYNPKDTELESLYHYIGSTNDSTSQQKLNFWVGGNVSNYVPIEIISKPTNATGSIENSCKNNCQLCQNIDDRKWNQLQMKLSRIFSNNGVFSDSNNIIKELLQHQNIVSISPSPEAILDILPTYYSREMIVNSKDDLYFFNLTFQVGKVYLTKVRITSFIRLFWRRFRWIQTEDLKYHELIKLKELSC